jgi:hypothetical protein
MRGGCICGAVRFEAEPRSREAHACHCETCRRWTGSALLAVAVQGDAIRFDGAEAIRSAATSEWAERTWCGRCGSHLYYRVTEGPLRDLHYVALGLFEAPEAFAFASERFIDRKPASYAFAGERERLTAAEVAAMYAEGGS